MHLPHLDTGPAAKSVARVPATQGLDFLWLELTNRCNLQCVHCYTESNPYSGDSDVLTAADYVRLMHEAYDLGCRKLQLIGGEPQLNPDFHCLLVTAKEIGFDFIEVFTNLTHLSETTLSFAAANGIHFATSVYSDIAEQHDAITKVRSSHARTVENLKRLSDQGIVTRAATIVIDQDRASVDRTRQYLTSLGVSHVSRGKLREFGRGQDILKQPARLEGLCGHCWTGKLCISPDGAAFPCVMARQWPVGNVLEQSLAEIVAGRSLKDTRQTIFDEVWLPKRAANLLEAHDAATLTTAGGPKERDDGKKPPEPPRIEEDEPCLPCPQSCPQDHRTPGCPQSCLPWPEYCDPDPPRPACEPHPE
jgi:MoaA/NifB/PqqE/SkfB family radical SAM enzyme